MPIPVFLNIYDLIPDVSKTNQVGRTALETIGMGCYHTGLEILGREVSFGRDASGRNDPNMEGVFMVAPRTACAFWKEQILLGMWASSSEPDTIDEEMIICHYEAKLEEVLKVLRPKWRAASYHMLSHNCNDFTFDLATVIASTGESRGVQVGSKSLLDRYPKWINRAAGVGNKVVPDVLLTKMLDSIQPPTACAPDLINVIMIPSPFGDNMAAPLDLSSTPIRRVTGDRPSDEDVPQQSSSSSTGLFGGLKSAIKTVATKTKTMASAHIHDRDEKQFKVRFGDMVGSDILVSAYTVTVRHINREQPSSKVFVTPQALYFSGPNELKLTVPWSCVGSIRVANVTERKAEGGVGNAAPVYTLLSESDVKFHAKEAPIQTKTDNNNNCGPQFAIMVFLTSIPPQLAPVSATILKQMVHHNVNDNNVGGDEGMKPLPMVIPMRKFVYGTFYSNMEVVQNALGHMNHMWQSFRGQ